MVISKLIPRKAAQRRASLTHNMSSSSRNKQARMTSILLGVVLCSVVTRLPSVVLSAYQEVFETPEVYSALMSPLYVMSLVNSSVNLMFYSMSQQFRLTLHKLVCPLMYRQTSFTSRVTGTTGTFSSSAQTIWSSS